MAKTTQPIEISAEKNLIPIRKVPQVMEQLVGVRAHIASVYRWVQRGKLRQHTIGGRSYVDLAELREFCGLSRV